MEGYVIFAHVLLVWLCLIITIIAVYGLFVCIGFIVKESIFCCCKLLNKKCCFLFVEKKKIVYLDENVV